MKNQILDKNHQLIIYKYQILILHFNRVTQLSNLLHQMNTKCIMEFGKKIEKKNIAKRKKLFKYIKKQ